MEYERCKTGSCVASVLLMSCEHDTQGGDQFFDFFFRRCRTHARFIGAYAAPSPPPHPSSSPAVPLPSRETTHHQGQKGASSS